MNAIKLSTGETIHLKDKYTHKMAKTFSQLAYRGVVFTEDEESGEFVIKREIPAQNFDEAYEAIIPLLIVKIERDGKESPYTQEWLDDLSIEDYNQLSDAVISLRGTNDEQEARQGEREKNR